MKKFGLNIQPFLRYTACFAGRPNFTSIFFFSNINQHLFTADLKSKEDVVFDNDNDFIREWINKKETQSFQLPK